MIFVYMNYWEQHNRFPSEEEGLAVLVPEFLPAFPTDSWETPFFYKLYEFPLLKSEGGDKQFGSRDDLTKW